MVPPSVRSRKVRRILRLAARVRRLHTRHDRALDKATRARAEADRLVEEARRIEHTLTGTQLGELRRARAEATATTASSVAAPQESSPPTAPR
jgi:hypothetical protein